MFVAHLSPKEDKKYTGLLSLNVRVLATATANVCVCVCVCVRMCVYVCVRELYLEVIQTPIQTAPSTQECQEARITEGSQVTG